MKGVRHSIPPGEWGLPGYKLALFLIPFLIVLIVPVANWIRLSFPAFASVGLLAIVSLLIIIGLVKGLPGWSLPSVGLGMGIVKLLVFTQQVYGIPGLIQLHTALWTDSILQRVLYVLIVSFLNWIPVMVLLAVLGLLCIWFPGLPILRQRFERDWTLLPFLLYATNVLTFLYADAYRKYEPYELLFILILAAGAWYYLWTSQLRNRLIALLVATLLSGLVLALGIYQIYPLQTWANDVARDFPRWWETIQPLLDTVALLSGLGLMAIFGTLVLQDKVKAHN